MPISILATKLYIPPSRPNLVSRARLIRQLNAGLRHKLTLISAPAGFGKTTLVSEWIQSAREGDEERGREGNATSAPFAVAWLSLDEGESDLTHFLTYLVAALQTLALSSAEGIAPQLGASVLALLQSPQPPPNESILTALLNEITTIPHHFTVVLDDYHLLDSQAVDQTLLYLLDHMPPQMHIVITTREDPNLPLARYRVRGELSEVRAADLRFTPAEAANFLNQAMGLHLAAAEIAALESRTEGWIAGLQLAALSLQGRADSAGFIEAFNGDHHFILDYLVEEVLQHQPEQVRNFLLQTAILDQLSGPLCDAVTGQEHGREMLAALERGNLFVISLDDKRHWYRYHQLFADVLQARALTEQPNGVPRWHRRASDWYEENGQRADAIRHAFAAADFVRAADLIELTWPAVHRSAFRSFAMLKWLAALPKEEIQARPLLSVGYGWELLNGGDLEGAEHHLQNAERWFDPAKTGDLLTGELLPPRVIDEAEWQALPAEIASARTYLALAHGDVAATVKYGQRALDLIPADAYVRRGPAASLLGLAYWSSGELEAAYQTLAEGMAGFQKAGNIAFAISGTYGLADLRITQGRLRDAVRIYERTLSLAQAQGEPLPQGTADLHLGLAELHHELGNVDISKQQMQRSEALSEQAALPNWPHRWHVIQARIEAAQGALDRALDLLNEAERLYMRGPVPDVRPIAALKARVWIKKGKLHEAQDWVREQGLTVQDELSYLREFEGITLARLLIAQYAQDRVVDTIHGATELLERLLRAAEAGERSGSAIEILALLALAQAAQDDLPSALLTLQCALKLAEPEGYVRIFVNEGLPMAQLLQAVAQRAVLPAYTNKLLTAFASEKQQHGSESAQLQLPQPSQPVPPSVAQPTQSLIEPLSPREIEVLQLIAQGLSNSEISEKLFLALSTVKGHNRAIFAKLQVQRRTEAVAVARELRLV